MTPHTCAALPSPGRRGRQSHSRWAPRPVLLVSGWGEELVVGGVLHRAGTPGAARVDARTAHPGARCERLEPRVPRTWTWLRSGARA